MSRVTSFPKNEIKVLLLEGIHPVGIERFEREGFDVQVHPSAMDPEELAEAVQGVHLLGLRSKTRITKDVVDGADRLLGLGVFGIGTNQVDLVATRRAGIPVFNAPHANTRSVAELVVGLTVMLLRGLYSKISAAHAGTWEKTASGSVEVRGKTLCIVGYGHIGQQVSVLAEALGMRVVFHDLVDKLPMGNAKPAASLEDALGQADVVTLHVPSDRSTHHLIGEDALRALRPGAHLINTSRGTVVDLEALARALDAGAVAGAALDVFPEEPHARGDSFDLPLRGRPNVLLTPHIGGSTLEAQRGIGQEVSERMVRFTNNGSTQGAVNFPEVVLSDVADHHRILHVHANVPGVLREVNELFAQGGVNIGQQVLRTMEDVGYLVVDVDDRCTLEMVKALRELPHTIRARPLF